MVKFTTFSAVLALIISTNAIPTTNNVGLEIRKEKSECDAFKKDLKKLPPAASAYCSSFIASTTTVVVPTTITQVSTAVITIPVTATSTETTTGPAPTVTEIVFSDCGIAGFDNGSPPAYFFDGSGAFGTFETCQARCKQDAGTCLTFAFGSGQCLLYTANLATVVVAVPTSPYTFFSVNCPAPASAPVPSAVKRQAGVPEPLGDYQPAARSAVCSCAIDVPATSTTTVFSTSVVTAISSLTTPVTVTAFVTTVVTPAPVTVTATTTA